MMWEATFKFKNKVLSCPLTFHFHLIDSLVKGNFCDRQQISNIINNKRVYKIFIFFKWKFKVHNILSTIQVTKLAHGEVFIGQGFNGIEVVKRWIFKFKIWIAMEFINKLLGQHDRIQKMTHKDVYALCNFNHHMNTIKYLGRMQRSPRMNLMSHKALKFLNETSSFTLSKRILTTRHRYSTYIHFTK